MIILNKYPNDRVLYITEDGLLFFNVNNTSYPCELLEDVGNTFFETNRTVFQLRDIMKNLFSKKNSNTIRNTNKTYMVKCAEHFPELTYANIEYTIEDEEVLIEFSDRYFRIELFRQHSYILFKKPERLKLSNTEKFFISLLSSNKNKHRVQQEYQIIVDKLKETYNIVLDKKMVSYKDSRTYAFWILKLMDEIQTTFKNLDITYFNSNRLPVEFSTKIPENDMASYGKGRIKIYVKKCSNYELFRRCFIHEYGHFIDEKVNHFYRKTTYREKLVNTLFNDKNVKRVLIKDATFKSYINSKLSNELNNKENQVIEKIKNMSKYGDYIESPYSKESSPTTTYLLEDKELFARCFECMFPMSSSEIQFERATVIQLISYLKTYSKNL